MADPEVVHEAFATMLRASEQQRVPVGGRMSMGEPYNRASHLIVQGAEHAGPIRAGDFILFDGPGGWIAHRVIWVLKGPVFVTKGDANRAFDRPYPSHDRMLGKVVGWVIEDEKCFSSASEALSAKMKVLQGLALWGYRAFLIRVLKREIRVEDLA